MDRFHDLATVISLVITAWCIVEFEEAQPGRRDGWVFAIIGWASFFFLELFN